ncbi:MAG: phosphate-binding protein [Candidatus Aenigmatarchaeota archaeon]|nr:MAG: phosphate-binding protein [Candidatus Aenigmarchaeota archaeon]
MVDNKKLKGIYLAGALLLIVLISGCTTENKIIGEIANNVENIEIKGSDTLLQLVSNMAEAYIQNKPDAKISVTGGGSGTGIAALINGEIDIADASRRIKEEEMEQAKERGINPWEFIIARDMLSVIVSKDNPASKLTIEQISKIYKGEITNWNEVGGKNQEITLYGRQSTSGTYSYFMKKVVGGDYSPYMMNLEGNQAIVDAIKQDKLGIGYAGLGYISDEKGNPVGGIKIVEIAKDENSQYISPLDESKHSLYPISRPLLQYLAKKPVKDSMVYNFLKFELNPEGQEIVKEAGFVPITSEDRNHNNMLWNKI